MKEIGCKITYPVLYIQYSVYDESFRLYEEMCEYLIICMRILKPFLIYLQYMNDFVYTNSTVNSGYILKLWKNPKHTSK